MQGDPDDDSPWPVVFTYTLQWSDLDANGHVNNLAFLRLFQEARIRYSSPLKQLAGAQRTLVVASLSCTFHRQLHYPGVVCCAFRVVQIGRSSYEGCFVAFKGSDIRGERVCSGTCAMVFADSSGRAVALSDIPGVLEFIRKSEAPRMVRRKGDL